MPYPGTIITESAFFKIYAASSAFPCLTTLSELSSFATPDCSPPKPPSTTLIIERFIPLLII